MQKKSPPKNNISGWLNIDKPAGVTSTQVVTAVKKMLRPMKIGHAGTLDPLATGILPLALGEATKTVPFAMDAKKIYRFVLCLGVQTTTGDIEGEIEATSDVRASAAQILAVLPQFMGEIEQTPPRFSAIKIDGKRAYDLARAGEEVIIKSRIVQIDRLELLEQLDEDKFLLETTCGKGTYIRSLVQDIARAVGSRGHVQDLRRLAVGNFNEKNMISLEQLENIDYKDALLSPDIALDDILAIKVDKETAQILARGNPVFVESSPAQAGQDLYKMMYLDKLIAIAKFNGTMFAPVRVFNY